MNKILHHSMPLPRAFIIFIMVMTLLSILGGYQLSQLFYRMNGIPLQRAEQFLTIEESLDDVAINLGRQIQEWKDMLLRANDTGLYGKHRKAFMDSSMEVQEALFRTKATMQKVGMDTGEVEQLRIEHKLLVTGYLNAQTKLNPQQMDSPHAVDKQVIGADRDLQQHVAAVKSDIEQFTKRQLNGTMPSQEKRYLLVGLLGATSLLVMALVSFIFASRFQGYADAIAVN